MGVTEVVNQGAGLVALAVALIVFLVKVWPDLRRRRPAEDIGAPATRAACPARPPWNDWPAWSAESGAKLYADLQAALTDIAVIRFRVDEVLKNQEEQHRRLGALEHGLHAVEVRFAKLPCGECAAEGYAPAGDG